MENELEKELEKVKTKSFINVLKIFVWTNTIILGVFMNIYYYIRSFCEYEWLF